MKKLNSVCIVLAAFAVVIFNSATSLAETLDITCHYKRDHSIEVTLIGEAGSGSAELTFSSHGNVLVSEEVTLVADHFVEAPIVKIESLAKYEKDGSTTPVFTAQSGGSDLKWFEFEEARHLSGYFDTKLGVLGCDGFITQFLE